MALVECRRFPTLPQALVARSVLEADRLHPLVFDEFRASTLWTEQFALGGIRIMVPTQEVQSARSLLADLDAEAPSEPPTESRPDWPGLIAIMLPLCIIVGWPLAGFRLRDPFHRATAIVASVLSFTLVLLLALARLR